MNVFAPNPIPITARRIRDRYAAEVQREADRFGLILPADPSRTTTLRRQDRLLLAEPVPIVSFTFGLPRAASSGPCRPRARPSCRR